ALLVLDRVSQRVPVVEDLAAAGFRDVLGHDFGLDSDGAFDEFSEHGAVDGADPALRMGGDEVENGGIGDETGLDDLGEAGEEFVRRQGAQRVEVDEDPGRGVEGPDEVLAFGGVDAGLAADGGIDHTQDGGGDVDDPDP